MIVRVVVALALMVSGLVVPPSAATTATGSSTVPAAAAPSPSVSRLAPVRAAKKKPRSSLTGSLTVRGSGKVRVKVTSNAKKVKLTYRTAKNKKRTAMVKMRKGKGARTLRKGSKKVFAKAKATKRLRASRRIRVRSATPPPVVDDSEVSVAVPPTREVVLQATPYLKVTVPAGAAGSQPATLTYTPKPSKNGPLGNGIDLMAFGDVHLSSGQPAVPLRFTWTFDQPLPEGWDGSFFTGDPDDGPFTMIPTTISADRRTATAAVASLSPKSFGIWFEENVIRFVGKVLSERGDRPTCVGEAPSWVLNTIYPDQMGGDNPVLACVGHDPADDDVLVVKMTNNRGHGLMLDVPADWDWIYFSNDGGLGDQLQHLMAYLRPRGQRQVLLAPGQQVHFGFSRETLEQAPDPFLIDGSVNVEATVYGIGIQAIEKALGEKAAGSGILAAVMVAKCFPAWDNGGDTFADMAAAVANNLNCLTNVDAWVRLGIEAFGEDEFFQMVPLKDALQVRAVTRQLNNYLVWFEVFYNASDLAASLLLQAQGLPVFDVEVILKPTTPDPDPPGPGTGSDLPYAGGGSPGAFDISLDVERPFSQLGPDGRLHLCNDSYLDWRIINRSGAIENGPDDQCFIAQDSSGMIYSSDSLADDDYVTASNVDGVSQGWTNTNLQYVWPLADGTMLGLSDASRGTLGHVDPANGDFTPLPQGTQYNGGRDMMIRAGTDAVAVHGTYDFFDSVRMFDPGTWTSSYRPPMRDERVLGLGPGAKAIVANLSGDCSSLTVDGHDLTSQIWEVTIPITQTSSYCNVADMEVHSAGDFAWIVVPVYRENGSGIRGVDSWLLFRFEYDGQWQEGPPAVMAAESFTIAGDFVGDTSGSLVYSVINPHPCDWSISAECRSVDVVHISPDLQVTLLDSFVPSGADESIVRTNLTPGFGQLWVTYQVQERVNIVDERLRSIPAPLTGDAVDLMHYLPAK